MTLALVLFAGLQAAPAAAETLPLAALVERVAERDPAGAAARAGAAEARAARAETAALSWPRLSAKLSYMRSDDPLFVFGSILQERAVAAPDFGLDFLRAPGYRNQVRGALEAGAPLFTGFRLETALRQAELAAEAADVGAAGRIIERRREAAAAALAMLAAERRVAILYERVGSAEAMVEDARRLTKSGLVLGSDFYAAQALLSKLKAELAQAEAIARGSAARLAVLAGTTSGGLSISGSLAVPPPLPSAAELAASASSRRGDLRAADLAAQAAEAGRRGAALSLTPTLEAFGQLQDVGRGFLDGGTSRLVGLRAELPFGDAGYPARRERAAAAASRAAEQARASREAVAAQIASARAAWQGAADALPPALAAREEAAKSLELFRPLYRQGRQSVLEVLRAEDALAQAELAVVDSLEGLDEGWTALMAAAGALDEGALKALTARLEAKP